MATRRGRNQVNVPQVSLGSISGYQGTVKPAQVQLDQTSTMDIALEGLLRIGEQAGAQMFENDVKRAYVKGQLERQQGTAKDAMEVDPLMQPFAKGGYADQDYRIKAVEFEQEFDRWLATEGRALDPDDDRVKEYLARGNDELLSTINNGMTNSAQLSALSNQVEANAARVSKHYKAHQKYVVEEYSRRVTPQGNQLISDLSNAMLEDDGATYGALTRQAVNYYQSLQAEASVPAEFKQQIGTKFLHAMLSSDQRQPVQAMLDGGLLDNLPLDEREKLTNAIRESENRTRNQEFASKVATFARLEDAGVSGDMPIEAFADHIERAVANKDYTPARGIALLREAMRGTGDRESTSQLLNAVNKRIIDGPDGVYAIAGNPEKALAKVDMLLRKTNTPTPERVAIITAAGLDFGVIPKEHGTAVGHALRAIGTAKDTDTIAPEHVQLLNTVLSVTDTASKVDPAKAGVLLNAMPEDVRGAMSYVMEQASNGVSPSDSLRQYWATTEQVKTQTPAARARTTKKWWDEHKDTITASGAFDTGWLGDAKNDEYTLTMIKDNVWAELRKLDDNQAYWGASEANKVQVATAHVMARTVPVPVEVGGSTVRPVVLDASVNIQSTFGTDAKAVGMTLAEMVQPVKEGNSTVVRWDRVNKAFVQTEVTPEGQSFIIGTVSPERIRSKLAEREQKAFEESQREIFGEAVQTSAGPLRIDGRNGQGEIRSVVLEARTMINNAAPEKVAHLVALDPSSAHKRLREDTDVAIAATNRFIAPNYSFRKAKSAVIAAAYIEGTDKMQQVIEAADAAIEAQDLEAFNEALGLVSNETIRSQLRLYLPIANPANQRATADNVNAWRGLNN